MLTIRGAWLFYWLEPDARYLGPWKGYYDSITYYTLGFWFFNIGISAPYFKEPG